MSETNRIEYKRELTPELDIEKEVVAFLNYKEGGYIYIGIDKDGSTVGVNDVDDCMLRLKDRIKHNISPSAMGLFDIAEEQKDGRSIIKVTVASGIEKPYFKTKYGMTHEVRICVLEHLPSLCHRSRLTVCSLCVPATLSGALCPIVRI